MENYTPITLFTLDEKPYRNVHTARSWKVERTIIGVDMLEFVCDYDDAPYMQQMVLFEDRFYTVVQIETSTYDDSATVRAETIALSLQDHNIALLDMRSETLHDIVYRSLNRTAWAIGHLDLADFKLSAYYEDKSPLYVLRELAMVTGQVLVFDTLNRRINMYVEESYGKNVETVFTHGRNVEDIEIISEAPRATTIIPYGQGGLTIESENQGRREISDYSWYTETMGIDEEQAERRYKKVYVWRNDDIIYAPVLLQKAKEKLRELSRPLITYKIPVVHSGLLVRDLDVGDWGYVVDYERGVKVKVRVSRIVSHDDPTQDIVELDYYDSGLTTERDSGVSKNGTAMSLVKLDKDTTVTSDMVGLLVMQVTAFKSTHLQVGLHVVGEAAGNGLIEGHFVIGNRKLDTLVVQSVQKGWHTLTATFLANDVETGIDNLTFYLKSSVPFKIKEDHAEMFIVSDGIIGGMGGSPNVSVKDKLDVPKMDVGRLGDRVGVHIEVPYQVSAHDRVDVPAMVEIEDSYINFMMSHNDRDKFADISKYSEYSGITQGEMTDFVQAHEDKSFGMILAVDGRLTALMSERPMTIDERIGVVRSKGNMYLLDYENKNTMIGNVYATEGSMTLLESLAEG